MPANRRQHTNAQSSASSSAPATAKYTNKDGSKFITIPKASNSAETSESSSAMAQPSTETNGETPAPPSEHPNNPTGVNRKKQKRRQKQAARQAAEQSNPHATTSRQTAALQDKMNHLSARFQAKAIAEGYQDPTEDENGYYSDENADAYSGSFPDVASPQNGYAQPTPNNNSRIEKQKRKGRGGHAVNNDQSHHHPSSNHVPPPPPPLHQSASGGISKEKIWNTSSQEERERIKEFWLSLGEEDRRSLVKVEKDAVLKKMKEQQKSSCSCTVCGRKRTAIEEELEILYDAYYEELEQYANKQQGQPPIMPPPRRYGQMSGLQPPNRLPATFSNHQPVRGRIVEQLEDEEDDEEEELSEEDVEDEDYLSEDEPEEPPRSHATDFFNFGNSLTVQGGILTVADDLLKNDGKKFIEMMEQLAERRMAREEDAKSHSYGAYGHPPNGSLPNHQHTHAHHHTHQHNHQHSHQHNHNHAPPPEDEEYDEEEEEDEEEYDSQDDYDDEETDTMTEEQRMEEGRRMFQIFAARMFEQRVLTAYKERVSAERQQKLLEELMEEENAESQKKAKKAKEAQKKKEKLQQKKQALAEEKAKRDAEKAAEEAAAREAEAKKAEEQRRRNEEKRKKKEAQKKAEEEERLRKEAEKQRRLQEQRERQAEQERRQREQKERERKEKEEARQREKEAREAKEREAKERKDRQEREKREREAKAKAEREAKELQKREEQAAKAQQEKEAAQAAAPIPQIAKRPQPPAPVPIPTGIQPNHIASVASPHAAIATPALPKAPTPMRPRQSSQQEHAVPHPATPSAGKSQNASPGGFTPQQNSPAASVKPVSQAPPLHHPQANSPMHAALKMPGGMMPGVFGGPQPMAMNGFPPGLPPLMPPGYDNRMPHDPMLSHHQAFGQRFRPGPGMPVFPGMTGMPPIPQGRGFPPPGFQQPIPGAPAGGLPFAPQNDSMPSASHSRQQSASFDKPNFDSPVPQTQPIARPTPIARPSSVVHGQRGTEENHKSDIDDLSNHLGSSALLDDSDEPIPSGPRRMSTQVPIGSRNIFPPSSSYTADSFSYLALGTSPLGSYGSLWGAPTNHFGTPPSLGGQGALSTWGASGKPSNGGFGSVGIGPSRTTHGSRPVAVRLKLCYAFRTLKVAANSADGFADIDAVRDAINTTYPNDDPVTEEEVLEICETEGNPQNGGGTFDLRQVHGKHEIRYDREASERAAIRGPVGEIGSPVGGGRRFPQSSATPGSGAGL